MLLRQARQVGDGFRVSYHSEKRRVLLAQGFCFMHGWKANVPVVPGRSFCQPCLDKKRVYGEQVRKRAKANGRCKNCPNKAVGNSVYCQKCWDRHAADEGVRRARKATAPCELVDTQVVFARDKWTCQHCRKKLRRGEAVGDHIIPLSVGGPHMYWNFQCLCGSCNSAKLADITKEPRLAHLLHLPIAEMIAAFATGDTPRS